MTNKERLAAAVRRDQVARGLGMTPDEAEDLLTTLPYSEIPEWRHVIEVVEWFEQRGWTRPEPQDVWPGGES